MRVSCTDDFVANPSMTTFKSALAHPNQALSRLYAQIEQQKKLLALIKKNLPEPLSDHVLHCVVSGRKLLVYTDTATWASQLRFYNPVLLKTITAAARIDLVQIRITRPIDALAAIPERTAKIPSPDKIAALRSNLSDPPDDALSQALLNLSHTLERLSRRTGQSEKERR
ncbi:MAG: DUF721 domain-containing protein [Gammaproteobacteria bacterium HGW-Gammaproteobacteria-3]|nr:MAG: DUF721 domain-containing protein [Gammaproteobacteria bacterium HGW-Gammaproteobacteria-3]